jgi:tetratricopeptide (TPR) repeat protein
MEKRLIVLGEDDLLTITTMAKEAGQLAALERYDEALPLYTKVLEKRSRILGNEHPNTLNALCNLAAVQGNFGRDNEARQSASRCLILARKIGDEHTAAHCVDLLARLDDRRKYGESTSEEQRRRLDKLDNRRKQAHEKADAARLKTAVAQSSTKEPSIDELMVQWGFDDDDGGGKKKSSNATSDGGGYKQKEKKGKGNK